MTRASLFQAEQLSWCAEGGGAILDRCSLSLIEGRWTCLMGPNGSGKSTLLQVLSGVRGFPRDYFAGKIFWKLEDWCALRPIERARRIAYVGADLSPVFPVTVREVVASGAYASGSINVLEEALEFCDLRALGSRSLEHLSGGERQRVALARALVQQAPVLFLDEALGKMDLDYQIDLAARLKSLILPDSKSPFAVRAVVLVTHDFALASRYGDEAWVLCSGRVLAQGPFNQVLSPEVLGRLYPRAWQSDFFKNKE